MMRKSLQPDLIAEAFSFMRSLLFRFWKQLSPVPQVRGHVSYFCGRNTVSKKMPLQSTSVFW